MLRFISLFAGIGGFDLALETMGMQCVAQVEIDPYATSILEAHWPNVPKYRDIRSVGRHNLPSCEVLAGGFPCQPHSLAGSRRAGDDERDLWGEFARLIREIRPRYVLAENVGGIRSSDGGRFFAAILRDLAQAGYDAEWQTLSAAAVGAFHKRERLWIVAYPNRKRHHQ
ncbi:MAG: DNA (cytosine-5-)-methyltransferase [Chloroflexi bacterium]|nr:DNA (cytosine-5-)-methyltransferase [Chloroflexota bacterium]